MMYLVCLLGLAFVVAVGGVAVNSLPQHAAGALVLAAGFSCAVLAWAGGSFVSIVLLLIYLGGMLVVFAYSVALVSVPRLVIVSVWSMWVRLFVFLCVILYVVGCFGLVVGSLLGEFSGLVAGLGEMQVDMSGVPLLYCSGWGVLVLCIVCLFVCLFVVLGLTRGGGRGGVRVF